MSLPLMINSSTYTKSVGTTSVSITLLGNDDPAINITAQGYKAIVYNSGTSNVYIEPGFGSATTAVFPIDGDRKDGVVLGPGVYISFSIPKGTTHLSLIADFGTDNLVHISFGQED